MHLRDCLIRLLPLTRVLLLEIVLVDWLRVTAGKGLESGKVRVTKTKSTGPNSCV